MTDVRTVLAVAAIAGSAALSGCGPYGMKGDRGLPPPPENMATPNVNLAPRKEAGRPLKSAGEQDRMKSGLLARTPRTARAPRPFNAKAEIAKQREMRDHAADAPKQP